MSGSCGLRQTAGSMMIIDVVRGRNWRGKSLPVIVLLLGRRIDQIPLSDPKLQVEGEEEDTDCIRACNSKIDIQRVPSHYSGTGLNFDSSGRRGATVGKCLLFDFVFLCRFVLIDSSPALCHSHPPKPNFMRARTTRTPRCLFAVLKRGLVAHMSCIFRPQGKKQKNGKSVGDTDRRE